MATAEVIKKEALGAANGDIKAAIAALESGQYLTDAGYTDEDQEAIEQAHTELKVMLELNQDLQSTTKGFWMINNEIIKGSETLEIYLGELKTIKTQMAKFFIEKLPPEIRVRKDHSGIEDPFYQIVVFINKLIKVCFEKGELVFRVGDFSGEISTLVFFERPQGVSNCERLNVTLDIKGNNAEIFNSQRKLSFIPEIEIDISNVKSERGVSMNKNGFFIPENEYTTKDMLIDKLFTDWSNK